MFILLDILQDCEDKNKKISLIKTKAVLSIDQISFIMPNNDGCLDKYNKNNYFISEIHLKSGQKIFSSLKPEKIYNLINQKQFKALKKAFHKENFL